MRLKPFQKFDTTWLSFPDTFLTISHLYFDQMFFLCRIQIKWVSFFLLTDEEMGGENQIHWWHLWENPGYWLLEQCFVYRIIMDLTRDSAPYTLQVPLFWTQLKEGQCYCNTWETETGFLPTPCPIPQHFPLQTEEIPHYQAIYVYKVMWL